MSRRSPARRSERRSEPERAQATTPLDRSPAAAARVRSAVTGLGLFVVFCALTFVIYAPALAGPFLSDDLHYVSRNPFVQSLTLANLREIWNPLGALPGVVENFAPVHLTLHALAWSVFGDDVTGHHAANLIAHAGAATLLAGLLRRFGLPILAAVTGATLFLVHPANVEAVAWISQLKSPASLCFGFAALLLHPRRPAAALLLFAAALFAKPTVAFAWPVLIGWRWIERTSETGSEIPTRQLDREWRWIAAWGAVLVAFGIAELAAFEGAAGHLDPLHPDPLVTARTIVAFFARYLAMAIAGAGLSTFHEPPRALSVIDPWWLAGCGALASIVWRIGAGLRAFWPVLRGSSARSERARVRALEALCWIWILAAFAPIAQLFPFRHPMADRYLYSLLPGLIGALGCALDGGRAASRERIQRAVSAVLLLSAVPVFAAAARTRAEIWISPERVIFDAARHYPDGVSAHQLRARAAAQRGDLVLAIRELRAAAERGYDGYDGLLADPAYAALHTDPDFREIVRAMAGVWIARASRSAEPSETDLLQRSRAHGARGEWAEAVQDLERALARNGSLREIVARELEFARARRPVVE